MIPHVGIYFIWGIQIFWCCIITISRMEICVRVFELFQDLLFAHYSEHAKKETMGHKATKYCEWRLIMIMRRWRWRIWSNIWRNLMARARISFVIFQHLVIILRYKFVGSDKTSFRKKKTLKKVASRLLEHFWYRWFPDLMIKYIWMRIVMNNFI